MYVFRMHYTPVMVPLLPEFKEALLTCDTWSMGSKLVVFQGSPHMTKLHATSGCLIKPTSNFATKDLLSAFRSLCQPMSQCHTGSIVTQIDDLLAGVQPKT